MKTQISRRKFLHSTVASAAAFTIVPGHVISGNGYVTPNDKITLALVGCGTTGLQHLISRVNMAELQVVAVCDPEKDSTNYVDFSRDGLRQKIAKALNMPDWRKGQVLPAMGNCLTTRPDEEIDWCTA